MFERFTKNARVVVQEAVAHADGAGAPAVDAEHMLLALLDHEGTRASFALASLGVAGERKESVRDAVTEARRRAGLSQAETDALAGLGIDVSEIVARVEEVHGVGAMSGDRRDKGSWSGRRPFSRAAKQTLEKSLRIAVAHGDRHIGDEHILLALTVRPGLSTELLADHGVTHESLTRVLYGSGEAKAG
ncbi:MULTISPECIES: Clp protease N-terminal domain-containing protein [unclassified Streptomyces]|uniref:Clp protease N-terminal domain-containing protein n=1 Tax=unclassified Streptomyces TaxID=2593676 RepID=UPI002250985B|nr:MULTISPECIES: Clp protease N-terminal domain-containing protein [unclassified Streptomyces]MCX5293021.1 peptidase [Streptomyces sp. NBC_00183]